MRAMHIIWRRCVHDRRGVALIEMAVILPFLLLLLFGAMEVTRYIMIAQRVDKTAFAIGDVITQYSPATVLNLPNELRQSQLEDTVYPAFARSLEPYDRAQDRVLLLSSVRREGNDIKLKWQVAGGGTLSDPSVFSIVNGLNPASISPAVRDSNANFSGEAATLLAGPSGMRDGENMIVVEVFFRYRPAYAYYLQMNPDYPLTIGEAVLARRMFFRPRSGDLVTLPPSFL